MSESLTKKIKDKNDWLAEYGFTTHTKTIKHDTGAFEIRFDCNRIENSITLNIYNIIFDGDNTKADDYINPTDMNFSALINITRDPIFEYRSTIQPILHYPPAFGLFGPHRGLIIAEMLRLLSLEVIAVEKSLSDKK